MFHYYNTAVKRIALLSVQIFLYPLEQKLVQKKKFVTTAFIDANEQL